MTTAIVTLPQFPQAVLAPHVPDLEVHIWQRDCRDILTDCGDGFELWVRVRGEVEGFDLFVEGRLASVVEAEEDYGVLCVDL